MGDFGLAEDIYTRGYFRQSKSEAVKLPFKWMAPESLRDGLFSEKSDVVSVYTHLHPNTMTCTRDGLIHPSHSGHLELHAGRFSVEGGFHTQL